MKMGLFKSKEQKLKESLDREVKKTRSFSKKFSTKKENEELQRKIMKLKQARKMN